MQQKRYGALDELRVIACLGIVMMHMRANNSYEISGFIYDKIIPSFTDFVFLFMVISSFGMCCGYYDKMLLGKINLIEFYKKRYVKVLPFFSVLVFLDLIISFSKASFYEAIADLTLMFGLFPNHISVIGVGWFLGTVFAFYLLFPFFCVLMESKKKAWFSLGISLLLNYIGEDYFNLDRTNIIYSSCFFIAGGLIFLYKDKLEQLKGYITIPIIAVCIAAYYTWNRNTITQFCLSASLLIFAISRSNEKLQIKFVSFISNLSMEIYLAHMVIFRGIEKLRLNIIGGSGVLQYVLTVIFVLCGTVAFSIVVKTILALTEKVWLKIKNEDING